MQPLTSCTIKLIALLGVITTIQLQATDEQFDETLRLLTYTIPNNVAIAGTLNAHESATIASGLTVSAGGATITGNTTITGNQIVDGNLTISGTTHLGPVSLSSNLTTTGVVRISGNGTSLAVNHNATIGGTLLVGGAVTCDGIVGKTVNVLSYTPVFIDTSTGALGTVASAKRYKDDIQGLPTMKAALMQLRPVSFTYKTDPNNIVQYGLIAEEVERVLPELVAYNKEKQPETVAYQILPTLLLNEYQDHEKRLAAIEAASATLRKQNEQTQQIIDHLMQLLKK